MLTALRIAAGLLLMQNPTPTPKEVAYRQACYAGVGIAQTVLSKVTKQDDLTARGLKMCNGSLVRLRGTGELDQEIDVTSYGCGYAIGAMFVAYGEEFDPEAPSSKMQEALGSCSTLSKRAPKVPLAESAANTPALPDIVSVAGRAVVSLRTYDAEGTALGQGSGFLVAKGRVVTNAHVVMGAARVEVYDFENNLLGTTDYAESFSSRVDLAVLPPMPGAPGTLRLAAAEPPVGTSLVVIGAPEGLTNTVTTGIVSAFRKIEGQRVMQISAPISQGSSGGPVLNHQGEVVAVSVAILKVGQNLNFAVPGRDVRALVGSPPGHIRFAGVGPVTPTSRPVATAAEDVAETPKQDFRAVFAAQPKLVVGEIASGALDAKGPSDGKNKPSDLFYAVGSAGDVYTAVAISTAFDARLDAAGLDALGAIEPLGMDDNGFGGTNPRLVFRLKQSGIFAIMVSSTEPGAQGEYKIVLLSGDVPAQKDTSELKDGRWSQVARSSDSNIYLDKTTARRTASGIIQAWNWSIYDGWREHGSNRYNSTKNLYAYDCESRQSRMLSYSHFADEVLAEKNSTPTQWDYWIPGSIGETLGNQVCSLEFK